MESECPLAFGGATLSVLMLVTGRTRAGRGLKAEHSRSTHCDPVGRNCLLVADERSQRVPPHATVWLCTPSRVLFDEQGYPHWRRERSRYPTSIESHEPHDYG